MMVCSLTLLRWSDNYSSLVFGAIILLATLALSIIARNRAEYRTEAHGVNDEHVEPNIIAVLAITAGMAVLGGLGLYLVATG